MSRIPRHSIPRVLVALFALGLVVPAGASAQVASGGGGAAYVPPPPPAKRAKIVDGIAIPPKKAPRRVKRAIAFANKIVRKPYVYGGGHKPFRLLRRKLDRGYDCSGAVSQALWGGRFLRRAPLNSSGFMRWGRPGEGRWVTVYTNPGHAYVVIAGLRFDTSLGDRSTPQEVSSGDGPRWRKYRRSPRGFVARHPPRF